MLFTYFILWEILRKFNISTLYERLFRKEYTRESSHFLWWKLSWGTFEKVFLVSIKPSKWFLEIIWPQPSLLGMFLTKNCPYVYSSFYLVLFILRKHVFSFLLLNIPLFVLSIQDSMQNPSIWSGFGKYILTNWVEYTEIIIRLE